MLKAMKRPKPDEDDSPTDWLNSISAKVGRTTEKARSASEKMTADAAAYLDRLRPETVVPIWKRKHRWSMNDRTRQRLERRKASRGKSGRRKRAKPKRRGKSVTALTRSMSRLRIGGRRRSRRGGTRRR
tara:strand:- start:5404 stop:5790 length:387 start_codon:yes stop_codon:yes gene_type:complete